MRHDGFGVFIRSGVTSGFVEEGFPRINTQAKKPAQMAHAQIGVDLGQHVPELSYNLPVGVRGGHFSTFKYLEQ